MDNLELLKKIGEFVGKRNCALTFLIPSNYKFDLDMKRIKKSITSIKHENKRKQLLKVINYLFLEIKDYKTFDGLGRIICTGLNKFGKVEYYMCKANKKIPTFQYYFGYYFYSNKIKEFMFNNIEFVKDKKATTSMINTYVVEDKIVYQNKIRDYLDTDLLHTIIYFSGVNIPNWILKPCVKNKIKIKIFNDKNLDDLIVKDNDYIGILKYGFTTKEMYI